MESTKIRFKYWFGRRKDKEQDNKKIWFLDNGNIFLEELIADCNGKSIPIRSFSSDQILKATNNFDSTCLVSEDWYYKWYRGRIKDRSYLIKIFSEHEDTDNKVDNIYIDRVDDVDNIYIDRVDDVYNDRVDDVYKDIVLSARMSNHNNFLKLLGCCLEFTFPVMLFEDAERGVLNSRGGVMVNGEESLLPLVFFFFFWKLLPLVLRLKIGKEIANAVTYLHMAFPKIIIHRDVKPMHVFLDKNWTAKLSDLSLAISLEEGKSQIKSEQIVGTLGYLDPLYLDTRLVTEYTDVYSFGVFLLVVMTSRYIFYSETHGDNLFSFVEGLRENGKLNEIIDPVMMEDTTIDQRLQVEACVMHALRCCERRLEDKPKMIQVAKELKRIETSFNNSS